MLKTRLGRFQTGPTLSSPDGQVKECWGRLASCTGEDAWSCQSRERQVRPHQPPAQPVWAPQTECHPDLLLFHGRCSTLGPRLPLVSPVLCVPLPNSCLSCLTSWSHGGSLIPSSRLCTNSAFYPRPWGNPLLLSHSPSFS